VATSSRRSARRAWLPHLGALLGYAALAVLVTWPTLPNFFTRITGNLIPDRDQNLWNLWWVREALLVRHTNPFHTDLLYYPYGVDLYLHDLALPNGLIALGPYLLFGLFAAYNTVVLASYLLTGYAAYRLVLYCLGRADLTPPAPPSLQRKGERDDLTSGASPEGRGQGDDLTLGSFSKGRGAIPPPFLCREGGAGGVRSVRHLAAFLGGVIFAFTAYSLDAQKQINILALEWLPLAAEAWLRAWDGASRRWAVAAALFLVLAMLVNAYYEVLLALFMAAYVLYRILRPEFIRPDVTRPDFNTETRRHGDYLEDWAGSENLSSVQTLSSVTAKPPAKNLRVSVSPCGNLQPTWWKIKRLALPFGLTAAVLGGPYAWGVWHSLQTERITAQATEQQSVHAADLLSFVLPAPDHPWLGEHAPWWQGLDPAAVPGYLGLGGVALALALAGVWVARRWRDTAFWMLLALAGAICALGTSLSIGGQRLFFGHAIPLPFALIGGLPIFNLIGKVERFELLTLLAMAVLGGRACAALLGRVAGAGPGGSWRAVAVAGLILGLLLGELPIYPRSTRSVRLPLGAAALAADPVAGPVLELPFVQVRVAPLAKRMLYQTVHGRPILAGYISRTVENRNALPCSPLYRFTKPLEIGATDIVTPATAAQPLSVLHSLGIGTIAQYSHYDVEGGPLLPPTEARAIGALIGAVADGPPFYGDDLVMLYHVRPGPPLTAPSLQTGEGWAAVEQNGGEPFRWIAGATATLCVYAPAPLRLALTGAATSLARPRTLVVQQDGQTVYTLPVPSGDFTRLHTPVLTLPAGPTELRLTVPAGADPAGPNDPRRLSIGLRGVGLEIAP